MSEATSYVDKWLRHEPGMELALVLSPRAQRGLLRDWGALLNELHEAVFEPSETHVAQLKLAWWHDELERACHGGARHPLLQSLFARAPLQRVDCAEWRALGRAALSLSALEDPASDVDVLVGEHRDFAARIAAIEQTLYGGDADPHGVIRHQLLRRLRLARSGRARRPLWPLQLRARLGGDADVERLSRHLASELGARLRPNPAAPLFRRSANVIDAQVWTALASGTPDAAPRPGAKLLWRLWRAARGA